jgi:aryl-alcohol dehydrogenase-like predicted oxidoreductase
MLTVIRFTGAFTSPDDFEEGDFRKQAPRFSKENFPKNLKLVDQFAELAKKKGVATGQLVLAWLLAQGEDIFPILEENVGALNVKLSQEEQQQLRKMVDAAEVTGNRYADFMMPSTYADTPPL